MKATTTMMFATAALLASAATGSAQTMKAEIPFAFQAGDARMQPGAYQVLLSRSSGGVPILQIYNYDTRHSAITLPQSVDRPARMTANRSDAILTFECTEGRCSLARLWDGNATLYRFPTSKRTEATRVATVVLRPERGE